MKIEKSNISLGEMCLKKVTSWPENVSNSLSNTKFIHDVEDNIPAKDTNINIV